MGKRIRPRAWRAFTTEQRALLRELPSLEARLARPVFYELAELGQEEQIAGERQFGVWSGGMFFPLGDPGEES